MKSIESIDKTAKSIGAFDSINYGVISFPRNIISRERNSVSRERDKKETHGCSLSGSVVLCLHNHVLKTAATTGDMRELSSPLVD